MTKPGFSILAYALLIIAFLLISCSTPSNVTVIPEVSTTSASRTPSPTSAPPTVTQSPTSTPISSIDILQQDLGTCPGFENVCTNAHAFGVNDITHWLDLRGQLNAEFMAGFAEMMASDTAWQAEYTAFFNGEAPPTGPLESLTPEQQLNVIAAIMLAENKDGFTPFNMPTNLINATIFNTARMRGYRTDGHLIGFDNAPTLTETDLQTMLSRPDFQVISFGQNVTLPWNVQMHDLGIAANDIIGPVYVPGKSANEAMYLFVYVRDQNNIPHPAFVEIPIAQQTLANGGYITHGGNGGLVAIYPATNLDITPKVQMNRAALGVYGVVTPIDSDNYMTFLKALWQAKEERWHVIFHDASTFKAFMGGIKMATEASILADGGTTMPPLP